MDLFGKGEADALAADERRYLAEMASQMLSMEVARQINTGSDAVWFHPSILSLYSE